MYGTLRVELKGQRGGEQVEIGIKDRSQPDDGTEAKSPVTLTSDWKTYDLPLSTFVGANLNQIYVLAEFVFDRGPQTIYVRRIEYLPR